MEARPETLLVSSSPHLRAPDTVRAIMLRVLVALTPAAAISCYHFGLQAFLLIVASVLAALLAEALTQKFMKRAITIWDLSAAVTGLLLAMNLPPETPLWLACLGSVFAIVVAKQLFGGLGYNPFNPALAGRVFLLISYPVLMTTYSAPRGQDTLSLSPQECGDAPRKLADSITSATPLHAEKQLRMQAKDPDIPETTRLATERLLRRFHQGPFLLRAGLGQIGGCLGEVSAVFLLLGGLFLLATKTITWEIPVGFGASLGLWAWFLGGDTLFSGSFLFHLLTGGFMLGAFFMATDMVTTPVTRKGQLVFGLGAGTITWVIRSQGGYPEGVSFAILLMNSATPIIDRHTLPRILGTRGSRNRSAP